MTQQTVALIGQDRRLMTELSAMMRRELGGAHIVEIDRYPESSLYADMATSPPSLVVIEVSDPQEAALRAVEDCAKALHSVPLVTVLRQNDPEFILRCLRLGATEFLLQPITESQLRSALDRVLQLRRGGLGRNGSRVFCMVPVKGACGATTIAANLPHWNRKNGFERVLLADMDPVTGTVSFQLKLKSPYSFVDAISHRDGLDADMWKGLVANRNGVDVLLAPEQPGDVSAGIGELAGLVQFFRQQYEIVVIDTGHAYSPWTIELASLSDEIVLVTTNELTSLRAAQRVLAHFGRERVDRSKVKLVVNRYNNEIGLNQEAIETALRCDVFQMIPSDYESVYEAVVNGKPVAPSTNFSKSVAQLAERLAGVKEGTKKAPAKSSRVTGFFSGMFAKTAKAK
jgi:pilus assembly protein CpaE